MTLCYLYRFFYCSLRRMKFGRIWQTHFCQFVSFLPDQLMDWVLVQSYSPYQEKFCHKKSKVLLVLSFYQSGKLWNSDLFRYFFKILICRSTATFLNLKLFPSLVSYLGLPKVFWMHSSICIFVSILAAIILPETQGLTLTELSNLYEKKVKSPRYVPKVEPWKPMTKKEEAEELSNV